jgi:hypothetical protein
MFGGARLFGRYKARRSFEVGKVGQDRRGLRPHDRIDGGLIQGRMA